MMIDYWVKSKYSFNKVRDSSKSKLVQQSYISKMDVTIFLWQNIIYNEKNKNKNKEDPQTHLNSIQEISNKG